MGYKSPGVLIEVVVIKCGVKALALITVPVESGDV